MPVLTLAGQPPSAARSVGGEKRGQAVTTVLKATDADDLDVLSARFQDALVRAGDIGFSPADGRFALLANRFRWEAKPSGMVRRRWSRTRAALHFNHVLDVKRRGFDGGDDAVHVLLAMTALPVAPDDPGNPERLVTLTFAAGTAARLHVECLDAEARDLGAPWPTPHRPAHPQG